MQLCTGALAHWPLPNAQLTNRRDAIRPHQHCALCIRRLVKGTGRPWGRVWTGSLPLLADLLQSFTHRTNPKDVSVEHGMTARATTRSNGRRRRHGGGWLELVFGTIRPLARRTPDPGTPVRCLMRCTRWKWRAKRWGPHVLVPSRLFFIQWVECDRPPGHLGGMKYHGPGGQHTGTLQSKVKVNQPVGGCVAPGSTNTGGGTP